ncbi:VOC family protein [Phyllobacterium myrsinacearum]|uniref:Glyoxalase n=1 Tax=Phyllobacterium myrsinacearum TaxID=28101 RepID=A0A2S9JDV8_9HYPH|nr:VOC family protein [Phyllobacterium myrsinacearum]PRD50972.1 glyoxalase [Phyllobacterium myrsinacearum]PWV88327.1 lactoylglutathione lyase [Phyllobacterium myrsinacearum]RZS88769.1 lactoylglutathione lyase [Phyllobacterium myrsinacearum]RZU97618.1 lactoylglutathione lyase [Phyllobacterium myrsinacearum]
MTQGVLNEGILGIYETHLPVSDLERSIAFYSQKVGLTLATEIRERNVAFFWVGGKEAGMLGLWGVGSAPLHMKLHFAFRATQELVVNACATLNALNVKPLGFRGEPVTEPVVFGWMPAISIYFKDPDGHSIELLHVLDGVPDPEFGVQPYSAWVERNQRGSKP